MLSKLRHILRIKTLRSSYNVIFESHLCYASLVYFQNTNSVKRLHVLQKKIIQNNFLSKLEFPHWPFILFKFSKILEFFDKTALENCNGYCLPSSIAASNFLLSHTLRVRVLLDGQYLVILKYPLTILKAMFDIQCL